MFIALSYRAILFIPASHRFSCLYQSLFIEGERLAGRYNAEERLRRLLRARRCAGRVRSVGTSREGRGSSRCRAAGSGKAAASTSMWVPGRRWRGCRG